MISSDLSFCLELLLDDVCLKLIYCENLKRVFNNLKILNINLLVLYIYKVHYVFYLL